MGMLGHPVGMGIKLHFHCLRDGAGPPEKELIIYPSDSKCNSYHISSSPTCSRGFEDVSCRITSGIDIASSHSESTPGDFRRCVPGKIPHHLVSMLEGDFMACPTPFRTSTASGADLPQVPPVDEESVESPLLEARWVVLTCEDWVTGVCVCVCVIPLLFLHLLPCVDDLY